MGTQSHVSLDPPVPKVMLVEGSPCTQSHVSRGLSLSWFRCPYHAGFSLVERSLWCIVFNIVCVCVCVCAQVCSRNSMGVRVALLCFVFVLLLPAARCAASRSVVAS